MITFIYLVGAFFGAISFDFWVFLLALLADFILLMFLSGMDN